MLFRPMSVLGLLAALVSAAAAVAGAPDTPRKPVTDEYHGVKVVDDYRWLENAADPAVQQWSDAQNAYARGFLDKLTCAPGLRARVTELEHAATVEYAHVVEAGGLYFASKNQPPKQQPLLVMLPSLTDLSGERVILDPGVRDPSGSTSVDWFFPSPDGQLVAVSLSEGGSESGNVHIFEVATGKERTGDMIPRVNGGTAGGWLAWTADSTGFFYTRYPREGERPAADMDFYTQLYFHTLGTPVEKDSFEVGKDYPKIAEIVVEVSPDGNWVLTNVQNGDGGEFIQDIRCLNPKADEKARAWTRLSTWDDRIVEARFGPDSAVYLVSRKNAPRGKVFRLPLALDTKPALAATREIVSQHKINSIETDFFGRTGIVPTANRLYVQYQAGGPNELHAFTHDGKSLGVVPQPTVSTIEGVESIGGDNLLFHLDSFTTPPAWHTLAIDAKPDARGGVGAINSTAMIVPVPAGMPELVAAREFATSKDGTKVPVSIIMAKSTKPNGKTPTIVWGYGGYGVNQTPGFSRRRLPWLEQGGIFAVANIRGGGEYGSEWHRQGNLLNKQNVFDDFYAAAKHMIDKGYTSRDHLGLMGGSNGGLLMGAMFTQHPDLARAIVSSVGIYDMLRVELSANGAFNITEFGTVKDAQQFAALNAYSPYHHVKAQTKYPAILFTTGANDPRVDPMQSRKMTALLQATDPKGLFLLRTSGNTGHGQGTPLSERIEQTVDIYGFFFEQLGLSCPPNPSKGR